MQRQPRLPRCRRLVTTLTLETYNIGAAVNDVEGYGGSNSAQGKERPSVPLHAACRRQRCGGCGGHKAPPPSDHALYLVVPTRPTVSSQPLWSSHTPPTLWSLAAQLWTLAGSPAPQPRGLHASRLPSDPATAT